MSSGYLVYMSIRKFLGSLVPGFALVGVLYLFFGHGLKSIPAVQHLPDDKAILYGSILLISYVLGAFNIQVTWRLLDIIGGWSDWVTSRPMTGFFRTIFKFCAGRLHVFSIRTLDEEVREQFRLTERPKDKEEYSGPYWASKMLILDGSPALAKEAMEIEGDINLYAGMFTPLILLGIFLAKVSWAPAALSFLIATFFAIRYQHLRHDDIAFVARAVESVRESKALASASPQEPSSSVSE